MHKSDYDRVYRIWKAMRTRCNNPNANEYRRYGGRGIKVCAEWDDYSSFYNWSISHGYEDHLTIDRIDNDKGYSPDNCRWITIQEQQQTRSNCILITYQGKTRNIAQWERELGIARKVLERRLRRGIPFEVAIQKKVIA